MSPYRPLPEVAQPARRVGPIEQASERAVAAHVAALAEARRAAAAGELPPLPSRIRLTRSYWS